MSSSRFRPAKNFYVSGAQRWDHMNPVLLKFPKLPVRARQSVVFPWS